MKQHCALLDSKGDERDKLSKMETSEDDSTPLESIDFTMTKVSEALSKQVLKRQKIYTRKEQQLNINTRKAPHTPKRVKSSYIIFFTENRERILHELGGKANDCDIYKHALELWKYMSVEQRNVWQNKALKDKKRFEAEKSICKGFLPFTFDTATKHLNSPKKPRSWVITSIHTAILNRYRKSTILCFWYTIKEPFFVFQEIEQQSWNYNTLV